MSLARRVCVIGAGIAGLVVAKVLKADGFEVVVFEKQAELGGVWAASRTYPGLRANNPRETYAFSDYPYPASADEFPTAEQVRAYLGAYADQFDLRPLIRCSQEVISVSRDAAHGGGTLAFQVVVQKTAETVTQTMSFDFVVICNGVFSEPLLPQLEGRAEFQGAVLHSSQLIDPHLILGKRVVVVGAGKSALDCASWAARHGHSCTLVFRQPHWMAPRYFFKRIRADRFIFTRFTELFLRYHRLEGLERLLHDRLPWLVGQWWRLLSALLRRALEIPSILVPGKPLPSGFENIGIGGEFYDALKLGRLALRHARVQRFASATTVELDSGESLQADVVIFATGWRQGVPFLETELLNTVQRNAQLWLYRHILVPKEPRLGFVGYASSTACQLTSEIAAHWLSQCFRGELPLPSVDAMEQEISRVLHWAAETFPARDQGYFIGPYVSHYVDDLLGDMGLPRRRTSNGWLEFFAPFWPNRYQNLTEQRRARRGDA